MKKGFLKRNSFLTAAALSLFIGLLGPPPAAALPWVDGATESLTTDAGKYAYVTVGGDAVGTLNHSAGTLETWELFLGFNSGSSGTYNLSGTGAVEADYEWIGLRGTGVFNQTGGTHTVWWDLYLGDSSGSSGTYNLSGGALSALREYIGYVETGVFNQTGGTNTVLYGLTLGFGTGSSGTYNQSGGYNNITDIYPQGGGGGELRLGSLVGSSGTYNLSGTGALSAFSEYIGVSGAGEFNQTGGTNTVLYDPAATDNVDVGNLYLGLNSGSSGRYNLSGGTLTVGGNIVNGLGTGTLNIDGGTLTVGGGVSGSIDVDYFTVGNATGSNGSFTLNSGQSLSAFSESIGLSGTGELNQDGGTNSANYLSLGVGSGSSGTYNLSGGALSADQESIGVSGTGEFNQTGGTNTVTNDLHLGLGTGSSGTYNLTGGTLDVGGSIVNGTGTSTFNIDGLVGNWQLIGSAWNNLNVDHFNVGNASGSNGSFTLNSGKSLLASQEIIGYSGIGVFNQSGGTNTVTDRFYLGLISGSSSGTYNLSDGALSANIEYIGTGGTGEFNQSGGTNTVSGSLILRATPGSSGTYNLSGGTLTVQNVGGTGNILNNDTFNYSGGTLNVDTFSNNGNFNLSGGGTRTVNGDVTNTATGTIKTTGTTAVFTGTFTNLGAYISDPSDNYFTDLVVGGTGYLLGGAGDNFYISGDFTNNSTQNTLWNTVNAYLAFTGAGAHTMSITGSIQASDFSFGTLEVFGGGTLNLTGASLYVNNLVLGAGSTVNLSGINLYYTSLTDYGGTYFGGQLLQVANISQVPEPGTILLLATGLAGLVGLRRRLRA